MLKITSLIQGNFKLFNFLNATSLLKKKNRIINQASIKKKIIINKASVRVTMSPGINFGQIWRSKMCNNDYRKFTNQEIKFQQTID